MQITIPSNWNNVSIEGYVSFMKSIGKKTETVGDLARLQISRTCFITGCEVEDAQKLTTKEYTKVQRLIKAPLPIKLKTTFKLKGIRYRLSRVSDLTGERIEKIKALDARKLSGGEYSAVMNVRKRGHLDSLHQVMYLLCEPMKWGFRSKLIFLGWKPYEFKPYEVEQRINDFKSLPMDVANPAAVFFCILSKVLTKALEDYSLNQLKTITKQMKKLHKDLETDLDGSV